jgi:hypothetical protein
MNPQRTLNLLRGVRDLQIIDAEGRNCGICDDVEFEGGPGGALKVHALLIGADARRQRLPGWLSHILGRLFPASLVRVPWRDVETITGRIKLSRPAAHYGLLGTDERLAPYFRRVPSL